jgi:hypothetical protein
VKELASLQVSCMRRALLETRFSVTLRPTVENWLTNVARRDLTL